MGEPQVTVDFWADAEDEASYQLGHWGETHDADKDDAFWFWTLGHIVGKAIHDPGQSVEKLRHRLRAGAALLKNWDSHVARRAGVDVGPLMLMEQPHPAGVPGAQGGNPMSAEPKGTNSWSAPGRLRLSGTEP